MIKNKNILITGNTSGIGLELNKLLTNTNTIFGISKSSSKIKNEIQIKIDIENLNLLKKKIKKIKFNKKIDYLILNAGILGKIKKIEKVLIKEFIQILKINFLSNKILIDELIKKKIVIKNIIAISSGAAKSSKDGWVLYCTSKAAFYQLINTYALEYKKIKFVNLAPGLAKTKMQDQIYNVKDKNIESVKKFQDLYRSNKISSPELIATKIINFLGNLKEIDSGSFIDLREY